MPNNVPAEPAIAEELRNVVLNYPLWPGDTLSHQTADALRRRGLIVRQKDGHWIPTAAGLRAYGALREGGEHV